jgi:addiction module RelE/StbE family toxin
MVQVNWSRQAIEDIHAAGEYHRQMSVRYADTLVDKIFEKAHLLEKHPRMGRMVPELGREEVRELIYKQYRIVYKIVNEFRIDVLAVHPSAQPLTDQSIFE